MRLNKLKRQWICCISILSFIIQPFAQAQSLNPQDELRHQMGTYLKQAGYFNGSMTHGEFASLVAKQLPEDGAKIVLGMAKPIWNKKMPRMEITATPFLRMTIHSEGRVYTLEVINSAKHFARFNGQLISWEELLDPKAFTVRVLKEASPKKKTASLLMQLLFPSAHAGQDDMFADIGDAGAGLQAPEPAPQVSSDLGSTTEVIPSSAAASTEAPAQPWYQSMFSGAGIAPFAIVAAVLGGAYLIGNGLKKDSKEPVVVTPTPTPRVPASINPEPQPSPKLESRFELVAAQMPQTEPQKIIGGVRSIRSAQDVRVLPRELNSSEGKEAIF